MDLTVTANELPPVSVIVPVRNEERFVGAALNSLLANDYPSELLEILVVDGMSDDRTREIVAEIAAGSGDATVRLLDNPAQIVPPAMNIGIRAARGEVIIRVDGHAMVEGDFIRESVQALLSHPEAWCAGGAVETVSQSVVGEAIAGAMSCPVGVGNARFRLGSYEGYVDTIAWGAYWRWVFDRIGLFDETLVRAQDCELNQRLVQAGGKIYMTPRIRSRYFSRTSLGKLWRQYYNSSFWRFRTMLIHRRPATLRQMIPLVFLLGWAVLLVGALVHPPAGWALLGYAAGYAGACVAGGVHVGRRKGVQAGLLAVGTFPIIHFAYALGNLVGIWYWGVRKGKGTRHGAFARLTR